MSPTIITERGVEKLLKNLNPHKAAGPDNIRPIVLKELHKELTPILTFLFQTSLNSGDLPSDWKTANVTPIFKKGKKHIAANYRPVSLTCICCKLLEHIISSNIMQHLDQNNILHKKQHGFRSKLSCETQLLEFIQDLHVSREKNTPVDVIVMDFAKAFDKVPHNRLLHKLKYYGVNHKTLSWISSFLACRTQSVVVEGSKSPSSPVLSGVPQGSVLGPLLFLAYINDLPSYVKSKVRLFADDTIIYREIKSGKDELELQEDLKRLEKWENDWQMVFHPSKCEAMRVIKGINKKNKITVNYRLHGHQLEWVDNIKYLGVTISKSLDWRTHINNTTAKANKKLGFLKRNLKISNPAVKSLAYSSLIRSQVEYASTVWCPHKLIDIGRVERVQRRSARWACHRYHNTSSVTDMMAKLDWPSLEHRRYYSTMNMAYKMTHGLVGIEASDYLTPIRRPTRHSHSLGYVMPSCRTDAYKHSFYPRAVSGWNRLPESVAAAPSLEAFRGALTKLGAPQP